MSTATSTATRIEPDTVLLTIPHRDLLQPIAEHEGFNTVEDWLTWAILSHAHMVGVRDRIEPLATKIAEQLIRARDAA